MATILVLPASHRLLHVGCPVRWLCGPIHFMQEILAYGTTTVQKRRVNEATPRREQLLVTDVKGALRATRAGGPGTPPIESRSFLSCNSWADDMIHEALGLGGSQQLPPPLHCFGRHALEPRSTMAASPMPLRHFVVNMWLFIWDRELQFAASSQECSSLIASCNVWYDRDMRRQLQVQVQDNIGSK